MTVALTLAVVAALSIEITDARRAMRDTSSKGGSDGISLRSSLFGDCFLLVGAANDPNCFPGRCAPVSALLRPSSVTFRAANASNGGTLYRRPEPKPCPFGF